MQTEQEPKKIVFDTRRTQGDDGETYPYFRDIAEYQKELEQGLAQDIEKMRARGIPQSQLENHKAATEELIQETIARTIQRREQMQAQWRLIREIRGDPPMQGGLVHILPAESQSSAYGMLAEYHRLAERSAPQKPSKSKLHAILTGVLRPFIG